MSFLQKIKPEWPLRLGLGLMYIYSGFSLFSEPIYWVGFVPGWFDGLIANIMPVELFLRVQGVGEFFVGLLFLAWFGGIWGTRIASILSSLSLAAIIVFVGVDLVTFRDVGLLGAAVALLVISWSRNSLVGKEVV
ncbi:MAG: hypothetical protein HYW91_00465 [Candidatus Sungbacteria bacterium]|nr:hypothetical protein [Candidatus Sungbacteria bacterium]